MPSRRSGITMTEEEQARFLEEGWTLQVSSIGPRGGPHLVPLWYVVLDGLIQFTTFTKSQKIVNLKRDPRVACLVERGRDYGQLQGLVIEGEAEVVDDDPAATLAVMRGVNAKYRDSPMAQASDERLQQLAGKRAVVRIHPRRISSWDHEKLGGTY